MVMSDARLGAAIESFQDLFARAQVRCYEVLFERDRNPLYPWAAWRVCRRHGISLPDWVKSGLDVFADGLLEQWPEPEERSVDVLNRSLGFNRPGNGHPWGRFRQTERNLDIAFEIENMRKSGSTRSYAIKAVAEDENLSFKHVERIYDDIKPILDVPLTDPRELGT